MKQTNLLPNRSSNPWLSHIALIDAIQPEVDEVATYRIRLQDPDLASTYRFKAGQFNMLYVPGCGESAISHSGSSAGDGSAMLHTIRFVGRVTQAIAGLKVGDQLGIRGPYGSCWPVEKCHGRDVLILSGGLGLAPLRPAIYEILAQRSRYERVTLLHGARSPEMLLYADEFESWRQAGLDVYLTVDQGNQSWQGAVGFVPELLDHFDQLRPHKTVVLTCGPEAMMHYSALGAIRRGVPEESIWISMERNMQCAVGLCGHCQLGSEFVCRDGPVFRYDQIKPWLQVKDL